MRFNLDRDDNWKKTYYVRDAQGNVLATYDRIWNGTAANKADKRDMLTQSELHIYGSSRVGVNNPNKVIASRDYTITSTVGTTTFKSYKPTITTLAFNPIWAEYSVGKRHYELSNHLGNVLSVITDNVWANYSGQTITSFSPDIIAANDYYPFGMVMPGRSYNGGEYRYGFNGQEKDDEIAGSGNSYTAEFWQYDSRLARRWNLDPVPQIFISDYAAFGNNPILNVDPNGAYFFKWFGSTSEQRNAANEFSKKVGGTVINKHSKEIVVSYTQQIGHKSYPIVLNRNQYFNKDGGQISDEGEIDVFVKNNHQEFKDYLDKDGRNWIESGAKFLGRGAYAGADGLKVAVTSFALTQDVLGLDGPLGLDGNIVPAEELTDRGVQGYAIGVSFATSFGAKSIGALVTPKNYSSYANRANWSRDVSRQSKTDQMRSIIFNAEENSRVIRDAGRAGTAVENIIQAVDEN